MKHMKQISYWAKKHKRAARFLIVFSFILINILGIRAGILLNDLNVVFSSTVLMVAVLLFIVTCWKYPVRRTTRETNDQKRSYVFQKICDFLLVNATFIMFVCFGNLQTRPVHFSFLTATAANLSLPGDSTKSYKSIEEFKKSLKDGNGNPLKWKERKKLMTQQIKSIKKDQHTSDAEKILLIILCVLLALVLAYGVAALSCSLSCSGSEGAAIAVAILGVAGIVVLTVFLIRGILRKSKKQTTKEDKRVDPSSPN